MGCLNFNWIIIDYHIFIYFFRVSQIHHDGFVRVCKSLEVLLPGGSWIAVHRGCSSRCTQTVRSTQNVPICWNTRRGSKSWRVGIGPMQQIRPLDRCYLRPSAVMFGFYWTCCWGWSYYIPYYPCKIVSAVPTILLSNWIVPGFVKSTCWWEGEIWGMKPQKAGG